MSGAGMSSAVGRAAGYGFLAKKGWKELLDALRGSLESSVQLAAAAEAEKPMGSGTVRQPASEPKTY